MATDYDILCVDCRERMGTSLKGRKAYVTFCTAAPALKLVVEQGASLYWFSYDLGAFFEHHGDHHLRIVGDDRSEEDDLGDFKLGVRIPYKRGG